MDVASGRGRLLGLLPFPTPVRRITSHIVLRPFLKLGRLVQIERLDVEEPSIGLSEILLELARQ